MPDYFEERLATALRQSVDHVTAPPDLAGASRARAAAGVRRRRVGATLAATVAIAVALAVLVVRGPEHRAAPQPARTPAPLTCAQPPNRQMRLSDKGNIDAYPSRAGDVAIAAIVCPTGDPAQGSGWTLPTRTVTSRDALALVDVSPDSVSIAFDTCPTVPTGPPFTVTLLGRDGERTAYQGSDLRCGGRWLIASFTFALAEQDSLAAAERGTAPPCPAITAPQPLPPALAPKLTTSTVVTTVLLCYHPGIVLYANPIVPQPVTRLDATAALAPLLTDDLHAGAADSGSLRSCPANPADPWDLNDPLVSLRLRTAQGQVVDLRGACADSLWVDGATSRAFVPSPATSRVIAGLIPR